MPWSLAPRLALALTMANLALVAPDPALAATPPTAPTGPPAIVASAEPSPATAAFIAALGPLAVGAGSGLLYHVGYRDTTPWLVAAALGPLAVGAGHFYAGDPLRGLGVGIGTYYAAAGGLLAGAGLWLLVGEKRLDSLLLVPLATASVVVLGYYGWAIMDAARTAERMSGRFP